MEKLTTCELELKKAKNKLDEIELRQKVIDVKIGYLISKMNFSSEEYEEMKKQIRDALKNIG